MAQVAIVALAASAVLEGIATYNAKKGEAEQLLYRAQTTRAKTSRDVADAKQEQELLTSRARAVMATTGSSIAASPDIVKTLGDIEGEGEYRAMMALWNGEELARGDEYGAKIAEREGKAALVSGIVEGTAIAAAGGSSFKSKYNADAFVDPGVGPYIS